MFNSRWRKSGVAPQRPPNAAAMAPRAVNWWLERGLLPDWAVRTGIRQVIAARLREQRAGGVVAQTARHRAFVDQLKASPIAVHTTTANEQHYEVDADFYGRVLGPHLKYSAGYWTNGTTTLAGAECAMLDLVAERAQLCDGQQILDLGCGWGRLPFAAAAAFPG